MIVTGVQAGEAIATVLGIASASLLSFGNGRGWPIGALMVTISAYVYWERSLFGSATVQIFFLVTQLVGWWRWSRGGEKDLTSTSRRFGPKGWAGLCVLGGSAWFGLARVLAEHGGQFVVLDSFVTIASFAAQIAMVYGFAENWLIWFAVNLGIIGLSIAGSLPFFGFLSFVYLAVSVNGWREWNRTTEG